VAQQSGASNSSLWPAQLQSVGHENFSEEGRAGRLKLEQPTGQVKSPIRNCQPNLLDLADSNRSTSKLLARAAASRPPGSNRAHPSPASCTRFGARCRQEFYEVPGSRRLRLQPAALHAAEHAGECLCQLLETMARRSKLDEAMRLKALAPIPSGLLD